MTPMHVYPCMYNVGKTRARKIYKPLTMGVLFNILLVNSNYLTLENLLFFVILCYPAVRNRINTIRRKNEDFRWTYHRSAC